MLFTTAGLIIVGVLIFFGFQFFYHTSSAPGTTSTPGSNTSGGGNNQSGGSSGQGNGSQSGRCQAGQACTGNLWVDPDFITTVKGKISQALHLTPDQIMTKLRQNYWSIKMTDLAAQQGLSVDAYHQIEFDALQAGLNKLVSKGARSQQDADQDIQTWRSEPDNTDQDVKDMFAIPPGSQPPAPGSGTPSSGTGS